MAAAVSAFASAAVQAIAKVAVPAAGAAAQPRFRTAGLTRVMVDADARVPQSCVITGNVLVCAQAVLGEQVVIKASTQRVEVRPLASIGDASVISASGPDFYSVETGLPNAVVVGSKAVIGKRVVLDSCIVEEGAVVGDDSVVGEGAVVGRGAVLDPGTLIPNARYVPAGEHWGGAPARFIGIVQAGGH